MYKKKSYLNLQFYLHNHTYLIDVLTIKKGEFYCLKFEIQSLKGKHIDKMR